MENTLISFETAKLAKEKGFDIQPDKYWCNYYTGEPHNKWKLLPLEKLSISWMEFPASTQSLLQKWLREVHNIDIQILRNKPGYNEYRVEIYKTDKSSKYKFINIKEGDYIKWFPIYEEALEIGLQEGLKLIK